MKGSGKNKTTTHKWLSWNKKTLGPGWAYIVTIFHIIVLFGAAFLFYFFSLECVSKSMTKGLLAACNPDPSTLMCSEAIKADLACKLGLAAIFGAIGGALMASRAVVYKVRMGEYEPEKFLLWQITTPIHSAFLAGVGFFIVRAGLVTLSASSLTKEPADTYFVIAFSFLVGIASESFLHRLLKTARTLFGEEKETPAKEQREEDATGNEARAAQSTAATEEEQGSGI